MPFRQSIAAIVCVTFAWIPAAYEASAILRGKCHGGVCSWFKPLSEQVIATNSKGTLVRVQVISGESDMGDPKDRVRWDQKPYFIYAFCSIHLPTIMFADPADARKGYYVHVLTLHPNWVVLTARMSSTVLYIYTCHKHTGYLDDDVLSRFGYNVPDGIEQTIPTILSSPNEIMKY